LGRNDDPEDPAAGTISRCQCCVDVVSGGKAILRSTGLHPTLLTRNKNGVLVVGNRALGPELDKLDHSSLKFGEVQLEDGDGIGLIGSASTRFFVFSSSSGDGSAALREKEGQPIESDDDPMVLSMAIGTAPPRKKQKRDRHHDDAPAFMPWRPLWTDALGSGPGNSGAVKLEEIVGGPKPDWVVISNYMIDTLWLVDAWPGLLKVDKVMIFHGDGCDDPNGLLPDHFEIHARRPNDLKFYKSDKGKQRGRSDKEGSLWSNNYGCHHAKFFVLGYPTGIRLAVLTANLIFHDQHSKTQGVYVQDFPCKKPGTDPGCLDHAEPGCDFEESFVDYMDSLLLHGGPALAETGWPNWDDRLYEPVNLTGLLGRYDYTRAYGSLVPSVPGYHLAQEMHRYGHQRMKRLLEEEGNNFDPSHADMKALSAWQRKTMAASGSGKAEGSKAEGSKVLCQFSSFSTAKESLRDQLAKSFSAGRGTDGVALGKAELEFIWPTVAELRAGIMGYNCGAGLPGAKKNVEGVPAGILRSWTGQDEEAVPLEGPSTTEYVRARRVAIPHLKSYMRVGSSGETLSWFCLTSANMSGGAWGSLQNHEGQLHCCHWELGVLFTPSSLSRGLGDTFSVHPAAPRQFHMGGGSLPAGEGRRWRLLTPHGWQARHREQAEGAAAAGGSDHAGHSADAFRDVLMPIPFSVPTAPYKADATPWSKELKELPADRFGNTDCENVENYGHRAPEGVCIDYKEPVRAAEEGHGDDGAAGGGGGCGGGGGARGGGGMGFGAAGGGGGGGGGGGEGGEGAGGGVGAAAAGGGGSPSFGAAGGSGFSEAPSMATMGSPFGAVMGANKQASGGGGGGGKKKYVLALLVDGGDDAFRGLMESCEAICDARVHDSCFQWPSSRHFTLWEGSMTPEESACVRFKAFQAPPCLNLKLDTWKSWSGALCLGLAKASENKMCAAIQLEMMEGIPSKLTSESQLHLSIYRPRGTSGAREAFLDVRKATSATEAGSVRGTRVIIKVAGEEWDEAHMREVQEG